MPRCLIARVVVAAALITAGTCCASCGDWPWRHDMVDQPSRYIGGDTRSAAEETMPVGSELPMSRHLAELRLQSPIAPDASVDTGRALYGIYCNPCHGLSGNGGTAVSQYFPPIPDLTGADVQSHSDGWFYTIIANGTERMPRYVHELTSAERWEIVHFLRAAGAAQ
jgi:mono/diheme cytochrome c family protein